MDATGEPPPLAFISRGETHGIPMVAAAAVRTAAVPRPQRFG